ncbi:4-(cytidine 5'-diphospho)-2-C-methyl-D-erythritol kinase [Rhodobacteraceae bacterium]|nr:4-(cytidine 5'-diphospho)-2-C-methyl-D-erythritol kinase [Paracoccaceae bacterium]
MTTVKVFAPAKVNLTLHITGQRGDGYHLIDSLVSFATVGDRLTFRNAEDWSLVVDGPESLNVPDDGSNLAMMAAGLICDGGALTLQKNLPTASGIGGGSADAGAALRAAMAANPRLVNVDWNAPPRDDMTSLADRVLALGADVPMCLLSMPARVRGIGDDIAFVDLPRLPMLLVNPRVPVPTGPVFQALASKVNDPMDSLPTDLTAGFLINWLHQQRNDLETPALKIAPAINDVLDALRRMDGCGLARMSGSGATCFGLFDTDASAQAAGHAIQKAYPDWWLAGGYLGDQSQLSAPKALS